MKLSFLTKPTFPKFCDSFSESRFQPKITTFYYWFYWFWISSTTGLLVLNKFIEINTLIKRNLNFKCDVKSHKVLLPVYCNNKILSILFEKKVLTNWHTSGGKIITRFFKKLNNLIFIYNWKNRYWIRYLFRYLIQNNHNPGPNILLLYNVLV